MAAVPGTIGYGRSIRRFIKVCQALDFRKVNRDFLPFLPTIPGRILDAGAGAGQNAAALGEMGYSVVAIEPMREFLAAAGETYPDLGVTWIQDSLPRLKCLGPEAGQFDFILIDGVWHHLDELERTLAIERFVSLLDDGGKIALSLRHGPPGMGTHVFPTEAGRTIEQAGKYNLKCLFAVEDQPSILPHKQDVTWSRLVLQKSCSPENGPTH